MSRIDWDKGGGLVPAVVQDARTLQVLMLGYMNREAHAETLATRRVTFFSRTKERLWTKGEASGHHLELVSLEHDCDGDALLVRAVPAGPTCHLMTTSCFGDELAPGVGFVAHLARVIAGRRGAEAESSYTASLLEGGADRRAQKVGEEGVELAIAAIKGNEDAIAGEAADLVYHLLVLLEGAGVPLERVVDILRKRHSG